MEENNRLNLMTILKNTTKQNESWTLLLMRHGKSDWSSQIDNDFDRVLASRGIHDAPIMGNWIKANQYLPDQIICSPAMRAKQTVEHVCRQINVAINNVCWDERIYGADISKLLDILSKTNDQAKTLLMVGHNPGFSDLVNYLCSGNGSIAKSMPTAAIAVIALNKIWAELEQHSGTLLHLITPKQV